MGCDTSPINVSGTISLKQEDLSSWEKPYVDRDRVMFLAWFCPEKVKLMEQVLIPEYVYGVTSKTRRVAEVSCIKAETDIDKLTFSIKNIPHGRYDVAVIFFSVNPEDHASESMIWFGDVRKSQELNFDLSNGQSSHYYSGQLK
jgi:hypothetical protein